MQSWFKIWPPNGCKHIRAKPILFGTGKSSRKFLDRSEKSNIMNTDNSLEFGKACEELSWNHCKSTPHRSETNGVAERAVRRIKEGTYASGVAIRLGRRMVGGFHGRFLLSAERTRLFFGMGRHHLKGDVENHSQGPQSLAAQWLSIRVGRVSSTRHADG